MSEPRRIAVVNGYPGLVSAIRARKAELGMSDRELEEIAGLAPGTTPKYLAPGASKTLGQVTLGRILRALGLELIVSENAEQTAKIAELYTRRNESQVRVKAMHSGHAQRNGLRRFLREIGRIGGKNSRKRIGRRAARKLARRAARARWQTVAIG